jgi:hypothetical protein
MTDTRTRTRRPSPEVAESEDITTNEAVVVDNAEVSKPKVVLHGPFSVKGFSVVDAQGRNIAMAGISGDVARTGPGIAEALIELLNR